MTTTQRKILFETNDLVRSLNTQVAVLAHSNDELKKTLEMYIERLGKRVDVMDEKNANVDQRVTILRNDLTKAEGRIDNLLEDVKELKADQTAFKWVNMAVTAIVGTIMYFLFGRTP